jgi:hypothetical protein
MPLQVPEKSMTITDPIETHTFSQGDGSSGAAKITPTVRGHLVDFWNAHGHELG